MINYEKVCPCCGKNSAPSVKFCDACGTNISLVAVTPISSVDTPKEEQTSINKSPYVGNGCILKFAAVFFVSLFILVYFVLPKNNKNRDSSSETTDIEISDISTEVTLSQKEAFIKQMNLFADDSVCEELYKILSEILGFENIVFKENIDNTTNYELNCDGYSMMATANKDFYRVWIPNTDRVLYDNAEVYITATMLHDTEMQSDEEIIYKMIAEDIINANLLYPDTAKYKDEVIMKNSNLICVQGNLTSENKIGDKVKMSYIVQYNIVGDYNNMDYSIVYINLDGETSGTFLEMY